jgi:SAM-dependent methyltransferase
MARSFASAASEYARGRPGYPAPAVDRLSDELGLDREATVLDLAAGTGKLTRDLAERFARVIAVEPLDEMRAELERALPTVEALAGSAEAIPLEPGSVDGVLVAQAFHWFDGPRALGEIARVLGRDGGLGLLWNLSPWEANAEPAIAPGWFEELDGVLERSRADLSVQRRHASGLWVKAFERDRRWAALGGARFSHEQRLSRPDFVAAFASRSYVAAMAPADRSELLAEIDAMVDRPDAPVEGGEVVIPLQTLAFWTFPRP